VILLIDNYDSFVHNLARYFQLLGQATQVVRNDAISVSEIRRRRPAAIVISPGPCTPREAGCSTEVVRRLGDEIPMLGVCLGHQAMAEALGGRIVRSPEPVHGRTSRIQHDNQGIFAGLPQPLDVCRYHSLMVDPASLPDVFQVSAWTEDGVVMAIRHRSRPLVGVQFHPEAILTDQGLPLLAGFLRLAGFATTVAAPLPACERPAEVAPDPLPTPPVTF
jgi:anthranilate synthase component 2